MIAWIKSKITIILLGLATVGLTLSCLYLWMRWSDSKNDVAGLATKLATSEKTLEISQGLFAIKVHEVEGLASALEYIKSKSGKEISALQEQLRKAQQEILSLNSLVVKWRSAYEGLLEATQGEETGPDGQVRHRVDFRRDFGYIGVSGYTLTDPPEGYVKVEQLRPLKLTLAMTKNRNGTWSSLVTSSEDNVAVDIDVSALDLSVISPRWYQRLWGEVGGDFLGAKDVSLGVRYVSDRWSLGASCRVGDAKGCGLTAGFRIFK